MRDELNRSKHAYDRAVQELVDTTGDDVYLDFACFHAYIALDLLIKHILNVRGVRVVYPKNTVNKLAHSLDLLLSSGFRFNEADIFRNIVNEVSLWDNSGRYGKGVISAEDTAVLALIVYDDMLDCFLKLIVP